MLYVDTSLLVAYYCPEELSEKAEKIITAEHQPALSSLTEVEFFSAISQKIREGGLKREDGERIVLTFLSHLDGDYYRHLRLGPSHYRIARDTLGRFTLPLRTLDALHLAVAMSEQASLATADKIMAKSARKVGVRTLFVRPN